MGKDAAAGAATYGGGNEGPVCNQDILELPGDPASVGAARRFVSACLARWGLDRSEGESASALAEDVSIVTSELVTNAVKYAQGPVSLSLETHRDRIVVSVTDGGPAPARASTAGALDLGGRGLNLVEALSDGWGQHQGPAGTKTVWCRLRVSSSVALALGCTLPAARS